jgi:aspartyl protease family protein
LGSVIKFNKTIDQKGKYMKLKITISALILMIIFALSSCSHRRRNTSSQSSRAEQTQAQTSRQQLRQDKTVVKMQKQNGVYYVPCKINDSEMQFIFDTGASDITMSQTEAKFLYKQGKLKDDDFIGTQQYRIADGSIAEGTVVNLHTVTIGNRTLNDVKASIVHNDEAPLLLGQSALAEFGKISIDYKNNEILFE